MKTGIFEAEKEEEEEEEEEDEESLKESLHSLTKEKA